jgi:predicted nucleic acid-binding Zn ribbon protein
MLRFELLAPPTKVCSPECVEGAFSEVDPSGLLTRYDPSSHCPVC